MVQALISGSHLFLAHLFTITSLKGSGVFFKETSATHEINQSDMFMALKAEFEALILNNPVASHSMTKFSERLDAPLSAPSK